MTHPYDLNTLFKLFSSASFLNSFSKNLTRAIYKTSQLLSFVNNVNEVKKQNLLENLLEVIIHLTCTQLR